MKTLFSIILAVAVSISTVRAGHGGQGGRGGHGGYHGGHGGYQGGHGGYHGGHGGHFSSMSPRGGHKFSRSGSTFSRGGKWSGGKWSGGKWSGGNWSGRNWGGGDRFVFIGGFGYPYYWDWYPSWGWGIPYAFNYGYYSSGYNTSHRYDYDRYSDPAYGHADRSSIAQLQRRLARAGYYNGAIDGIMGSQTRRAIRAYERAYVALSMR